MINLTHASLRSKRERTASVQIVVIQINAALKMAEISQEPTVRRQRRKPARVARRIVFRDIPGRQLRLPLKD
jgi:hypothetical protein